MADPQITLRIVAEEAYQAVINAATNDFKALGNQGAAAGDRLSKSFQTLNIKSALDIEAEKARAIAAFEAIKKSGVASASEITRAQQALNTQLNKLDSVNKPAAASTNLISTGLKGVAQWLAGAFAIERVVAFTRAAFEASMAVDSITSKLKIMSGSDKAAAVEWEFIRSEAQRLGLDLLQTADSYSTFAVATKGTSIEGKMARQVFSSLMEATTALHLPAEKASAVMYQFQQMLSKGKVNMQDLRVAAESFPGLMTQLSQSLGITTSQLMKQMEAGTLMTADVLPKLAEQLHKTYGASATEAAGKGRGALNKFNTALFELKAYFGESTNGAEILGIFKYIVEGAKSAIMYVQKTTIYLMSMGEKVTAYMTMGGEDLQNKMDDINKRTDESLQEIDNQHKKWADKKIQTEKQANQATAEETAAANEKRRKEAQKTGEDLSKVNQEYAKMTGNSEVQLTAELDKQYEDRKKATIDFYNQKKAYAKNDIEEATFEILKNGKLLEIEKQHQRDLEIVKAQTRSNQLSELKNQVALEIILIQEKMAKNLITSREGERQISELTVASAKVQYDAKKAVTDKIVEIYGKGGEEYKKALKEQESAHKDYLSANLTAYKKHADNIKSIDKEIADFRRSIQDKIKDIQQKGMTDSQKYADDQKRFNEAISKANAALAQKDYETAQKYNKQAEELASRLVDKKVEGNTKLMELEKQHQEKIEQIQSQGQDTKLTDQQKQAGEIAKENAAYEKQHSDILREQAATQQGVTTATAALNEVEKQGVQIMEAKKKENTDALEKLKQIQDMKLDPKNLQVNVDQAALTAVKTELDALTAPATKVINVVYRSSGSSGEASFSDTGSSGGAAEGYFEGGKVTNGSSLMDSVNAMLARDEWVINNKATRFWGDGVLAAVNAPFSAAGQRLQAALNSQPTAAPEPVNLGTLNLNIGGGSYPVQAPINVLSELNTAMRRLKMTRPQ